tara:strand:+ start:547 stop:840 length:294 start_codon:yes stop_codon:yes gene_type:complete
MGLSVYDFDEDLEVPKGMKIDGVLKKVGTYVRLGNCPNFLYSVNPCPTCYSKFREDSLCMVLLNKPSQEHPEGKEELLIPCYECESLSIFSGQDVFS